MKNFLVFSFFVASAIASGRDLFRVAEENDLELYMRYCSGLSSSGNDGDVQWHCMGPKEPPRRIVISYELKMPMTTKEKLILIEMSPEDFRQNNFLPEDGNWSHNEKVRVVPSEAALLIRNRTSVVLPIPWLLPSLVAFSLFVLSRK